MDILLQIALGFVAVAACLVAFLMSRKQQRSRLLEKLYAKQQEIALAISSFGALLSSERYLSKAEYSAWFSNWGYLRPLIEECEKKNIGKKSGSKLNELKLILDSGDSLVRKKNEEYMNNELRNFKAFFDSVEAQPLTMKQRLAIVTEEKHSMVVAGAGTGKTSTLIGKAGYILKKGFAEPHEILLISFARKARDEMAERALRRLGNGIVIETFHSLGLKIVADVEKRKPSVSELSTDAVRLRNAIMEHIKKRLGEPEFLKKIHRYFAFYNTPYRSQFGFKSKGEYIDFLRSNQVRSLNGELVKSLEECEIANFLYINGIGYLYEKDYGVETATKIRRQYKPDFFLPEYGIYIEHFGVDRNNRTAPFVDRERYLEEMGWKRRTHRENGTRLIETYSWEKTEGVLLRNLERSLVSAGLKFAPIPQEQIFDKLNQLGLVHPFTGLLGSFLNLYKSQQKSISLLREVVTSFPNRDRYEAFLDIFSEIYEDYEKSLGREIDFNDMINKAVQYVSDGSYHSSFKYVLVDEFQDISCNRSSLLKALLLSSPSARLFCVGDDWQSIYRFNGSDVSIMTDFNSHFDPSERLELDLTFRFDDKLCDFSSKFILRNPNQIRKNLISSKKSKSPAVTLSWSESIEDAIEEALGRIRSSEKDKAKVLIIGRYNHQQPRNLALLQKEFQELDIEYLTAHSSKGKESDYVIVIGLTSEGYAFPSQIEDDPVLDVVLAKKEPVPNAEERRLFYVAVTRARKHVYLVAGKTAPSAFISEVGNGEYEVEIEGEEGERSMVCPSCKTGLIISRQGRNGEFYSCSNYPYCGYKPRVCPECSKGFLRKSDISASSIVCSNTHCSFKRRKCPRCEYGYLILRNGKYSQFYGCSNYPTCKHTEKPA